MTIQSHLLLLFVLIIFLFPLINGTNSRSLEETGNPGPSDPSNTGLKCGGCSTCTNLCAQYPPPPPPPSPSPPPPARKKPPPYGWYCPPPPAPGNIVYITGPPGSLYPVDESYNRARRSFELGVPAALFGFLCVFLILW